MVNVTHEGERWEEIARQDPMWAILSYQDGKYGRWSEQRFLATGIERVDEFLTHGSEFGRPIGRQAALDFGCGVGRLTRALAARFDRVVGVDISETMLERARDLNADVGNADFRCNERADLLTFTDGSFDLVASDIVLQHLPNRETVEDYLSEFIRVLRPGGLLVFQLPTSLPLSVRLQPRRNAYRVMRRLGFSAHTLYWRLGLHPSRMLAIPGHAVTAFLKSRGAEVLDVVREASPAPVTLKQHVYYVTR
jgi:SAM-dependent methyltransferase